MSAPIYADPVHDGAADPTLIRNRATGEWWMFYTNRRAKLGSAGLEWIHGCPIGIATSPDGIGWTYRGEVQGLDDPADTGLNTHWAPEVIWAEGQYHMFLSYIRGVPDRWAGHDRRIVHFTSPDLTSWTRHGPLTLSSNLVIDACVEHCPDGLYRLWYKDEADGSSSHVASSPDLFTWTTEGVAIPGSTGGGFPHEGPNVFVLGGRYWMIADEWRGQAVFHSSDARTWARQGVILNAPGNSAMDRRYPRHADVVVTGPTTAALYYFTHPHWDEINRRNPLTAEERRTVIHVAPLWLEDGQLVATRDTPPISLTNVTSD
jgi:hypothetical protein